MGPSFKDKTSETESYPEGRYLFIEYIPPHPAEAVKKIGGSVVQGYLQSFTNAVI